MKPLKNYQLWYRCDGGYQLKEMDHLKELSELLPEIYTSDYYITKKCELEFLEVNGEKVV